MTIPELFDKVALSQCLVQKNLVQMLCHCFESGHLIHTVTYSQVTFIQLLYDSNIHESSIIVCV